MSREDQKFSTPEGRQRRARPETAAVTDQSPADPMLDLIRRGAGADQIDTAVVEDMSRVDRAVLDQAARWRADLIVIGAHRRRTGWHRIRGGIAEAVARAAPVPTLVISAATPRHAADAYECPATAHGDTR